MSQLELCTALTASRVPKQIILQVAIQLYKATLLCCSHCCVTAPLLHGWHAAFIPSTHECKAVGGISAGTSFMPLQVRPVHLCTHAEDHVLWIQALQVRTWPGEDDWRQQLCTAAAACLSHICQHTEARPPVQAAGAIPVLAKLCDLDQWHLGVVRFASAALASIAVGPDVKVCVKSLALQSMPDQRNQHAADLLPQSMLTCTVWQHLWHGWGSKHPSCLDDHITHNTVHQ